MKIINKTIIMLCIASTCVTSCTAQVKNAKTEEVNINGNCGMCKNTIETAGNLKKTAIVNWNQTTKTASITYDSTKTSKSEILKRIADAGYDNDSFTATDEVYNNLHGCCQYDRKIQENEPKTQLEDEAPAKQNAVPAADSTKQSLNGVLNLYFDIEKALVLSDASLAVNKANLLLKELAKQKESNKFTKAAKAINAAKDIGKQRTAFASLSEEIYTVLPHLDLDNNLFWQYCSMALNGNGANWLSQEKTISNPYYGASMLRCGEEIKVITANN